MTLTQHGKTEDGKSYFFEVSVDAEQFEKAVGKAYKKNVGKINIDGFRKGKAPRAIIERAYGESVFFDDAIDELLPDCYRECLDTSKIEVIDRPSVDIKSVDKQNGFTARFEVLLRPQLTVKKHKGLSAKHVVEKVTDEQIEKEVADLQFKQSRLEAVTDRPAADGDSVTFDFEGFVDGEAFDGGKAEKYTLTLGSGQFIEGFEPQLVGHAIGEEFDVSVRFPEDYGAENLAGKDAIFKCKIHEIRARELPEINDELAKDADFDNLEELRADIRARLEKAAEENATNEFEQQLFDKLTDGLEGEIPEVMIETRVDDMVSDFEYRLTSQGLKLADYLKYMGADMPAFRAQYREQAEKQVKLRLALEAVARAEELSVSDEDVAAELARMAEQYNMELDKLKGFIHEDDLRKDLLTTKALEFVKENAKKTTK